MVVFRSGAVNRLDNIEIVLTTASSFINYGYNGFFALLLIIFSSLLVSLVENIKCFLDTFTSMLQIPCQGLFSISFSPQKTVS